MKTLLTPALFLSAFLPPPGLPCMARADEPLKAQLESIARESAGQTPEATRLAYAAGIKAVGDSGITQSAKQTGDPAPDFTFQLTPEVRDLYRQKFNLTDFNGAGAGDDQLPLAATYIIGQDGIIRYAFLHADYRERAEPETLVSFLKANRKNLTTQP